MAMEPNGSSFSSLASYLQAVTQTPTRLLHRATSVSTSYQEMSHVRARSGSDMKKTLRWYDLIGFGLGGMLGAGVFVTTGKAILTAGPAVIISFAIAGICALLSAFCYTEFAVDMPVAGGAFSYIRITFGEFLAFLTGANLVMEYVMSNAAVARSFTAYFASAINVSTDKWRFKISGLPDGFNDIDFIAVALILIITIIICYSTKDSSVLNMTLTALHLVFILFVIMIGFCRGHWSNFNEPGKPDESPSGFFPFGAAGVFKGASVVYVSYIGYDAVSTMAEEVRNPVKDIPIGVSGSVIIVTVLYCLMSASMSMILPYDMVNKDAPFTTVFNGRWKWVSNVIAAGASFGILTSQLVAMLGQARYMCVIGRSNVVPVWFAKVHPKTSTPVNASVFLGILTAAIALFTELGVLLDLVSIGTLFVFYMVANAVIYRRYIAIGTTNPLPTLSFLLSFSFTAILFTLIWKLAPEGHLKTILLVICAVISIAILQIFSCTVKQARKPEFWGVPLMPWTPCVSIFLNIFLLGSIDGASYVRFGIFSAFLVLVYVLYSVHASSDAERDGSLCLKYDQVSEVEMKETGDQTQKV